MNSLFAFCIFCCTATGATFGQQIAIGSTQTCHGFAPGNLKAIGDAFIKTLGRPGSTVSLPFFTKYGNPNRVRGVLQVLLPQNMSCGVQWWNNDLFLRLSFTIVSMTGAVSNDPFYGKEQSCFGGQPSLPITLSPSANKVLPYDLYYFKNNAFLAARFSRTGLLNVGPYNNAVEGQPCTGLPYSAVFGINEAFAGWMKEVAQTATPYNFNS